MVPGGSAGQLLKLRLWSHAGAMRVFALVAADPEVCGPWDSIVATHLTAFYTGGIGDSGRSWKRPSGTRLGL